MWQWHVGEKHTDEIQEASLWRFEGGNETKRLAPARKGERVAMNARFTHQIPPWTASASRGGKLAAQSVAGITPDNK